jgi:chromate transport protein ChrA
VSDTPPAPGPQSRHGIGLREATTVWAHIGLNSFGGPAGQIAVMHRELVERRRWVSERRFLHALNYCMILHGPEAQQLATYIGWLMHGTTGGVIAGVLFVLPGFFAMLILAATYALFGTVTWIAGLLFGLQAAVVAIVAEAVVRIGRRTLRTSALQLLAAADRRLRRREDSAGDQAVARGRAVRCAADRFPARVGGGLAVRAAESSDCADHRMFSAASSRDSPPMSVSQTRASTPMALRTARASRWTSSSVRRPSRGWRASVIHAIARP